MKLFNVKKSIHILLLAALLTILSGSLLVIASVIGIHPDHLRILTREKDIQVQLELWSEYALPQPAKLALTLEGPEEKVIKTATYQVTLKPGHGNYYTFTLPAKVDKEKLYDYLLRYTLTTPDGNSASGSKILFDVVPQMEVYASGGDEAYPGSKASMRIQALNHADKKPINNASIVVTAVNPETKATYTLLKGKTNQKGLLETAYLIPANLGDTKTLDAVIKVTSTIGEETIQKQIQIKAGNKILLTTDKPLYQPGQTIHIRALALKMPDLVPASGEPVILEVSDSKGNKVHKFEMPLNEFGIASTDFILADEVNTGLYTVKAILGDTQTEKKVTVDKYVLPKFKIAIKTQKDYYGPGEILKGEIQSDYFFGKPVEGGKVIITASKFEIQFEEFNKTEGTLDKNGHYSFELKLPAYFAGTPLEEGKASVKLDVAVIDNADHRQDKTAMVPISKESILLYALPESGKLKQNLNNTVYLLARYPDGSPAPCQINCAGKNYPTDEAGIAVVQLAAKSKPLNLQVTAKDKKGNQGLKYFNLEYEPGEDSILMRTDKALYTVGDPMKLDFYTTQPEGTVFLDIIKEGQTILSRSIQLKDAHGQIQVPLDETMSGNLLLHSYLITRTGNIIRDTRWIFANPANDLIIKIRPDKDIYRPGEPAALGIQVTEKKGQGVPTALGISIVDEAVYALQEMQPGLEKIYFLLEKEILEPRYEIHGFDPQRIILHKSDIEEKAEEWAPAQQQEARVLFAASVPAAANLPPVTNSISPKLEAYNDALEIRIGKIQAKVQKALQSYYNRYKEYPGKTEGYEALIRKGFLKERDLLDPWGTPCKVEPIEWSQTLTPFNLHSAGPDKVFNTGDDITVNYYRYSRKFKNEMPQFGEGFFAEEKAAGRLMVLDSLEVPSAAAKPEQAKEEPRLRMYFPETLYFNPCFLTDMTGKGTLKLKMADSITSWRLTALASGKKGQMGSITTPIRVFQDFFVDIDLPVTLTQNDQVSIPVAVYNYLPSTQKVRLELTKADWFELQDEAVKTVEIQKDQVKAVYFTIKVKGLGYHPLQIKAYGEKMSDAIQRSIEVMPDGKETLVSYSERLTGNVNQNVQIPADAVAGASKILVKIYPGLFSQVVEGLDSMFRMPFGCFEQTSSVTYPNILVLRYLKQTGQLTPEVEMKAKQYINIGYQRLLSYEVNGGGFEWFGNPPANQILTAWGLMEFNDMAKVHTIDPNIISRTREWLLNKQQADGSWNPDAAYLHAESWQNIQNSKTLVTAYITWSLSEIGYKGEKLDKAVKYIEAHYQDSQDAYTLALIANALANAAPDSPALDKVFDKLMALKKEKGEKTWWETGGQTVTYTHGSAANVEVTSLVCLAMMKTDRSPNTVTQALNYIISAKDTNGNWGSTQGTILALKTLLTSLNNLSEKVDASIDVLINGKPAGTVQVTPKNSDVMRMLDLGDKTQTGSNNVELKFKGTGSMMYQIIGKYYLPWTDIQPARPILDIKVDYDKTSLEKNDLVTAHVSVTNTKPAAANMVIIDLGIPPGFEVIPADFEKMVEQKTIQKYTLTGRQIIVYLEKIPGNKTFNLDYQLKAKFPIKAQTPPSSAYEYYNPENKSHAKPVTLVVK
jgi:uncharacterized protein YfaS (alpha-2-macroglobulin family)